MCLIIWNGKTCRGYPNVQNQSAPHLRASFAKLNDNNINYNLSNLETDPALPRPKTNFLKRSFKYCAMLWNNLSYEARAAHRCPNLKANFPLCLLLDRSDAIICMCVYFVISLQNSHQHNCIVNLSSYIRLYCIHFYILVILLILQICEHHTASNCLQCVFACVSPGNQLLLRVVSVLTWLDVIL